MTYNRAQVRTLLSDSETPLFESSLGASCKGLEAGELRRSLKRARTMRDKARDLLQQQRLATRARTGSKGGIGGVANERTAEKVTVFDEMVTRFETEASRRDAPSKASKTAAKKAVAKKPVAKRAVAKKAIATKTIAKNAVAKKAPAKKATAPKRTATKRARPAASVLREALVKKEAARDDKAPGARATGGAKAPARGNEATPVGGVQATGPSARARAVSSRLADSNLAQIQGHTSTQVRRGQAKRDQKG